MLESERTEVPEFGLKLGFCGLLHVLQCYSVEVSCCGCYGKLYDDKVLFIYQRSLGLCCFVVADVPSSIGVGSPFVTYLLEMSDVVSLVDQRPKSSDQSAHSGLYG